MYVYHFVDPGNRGEYSDGALRTRIERRVAHKLGVPLGDVQNSPGLRGIVDECLAGVTEMLARWRLALTEAAAELAERESADG